MISKENEMLISCFDDSDLSTDERTQLDYLLHSDPQARDLLEQYKKLNQHLENLPNALDNLDLSSFTKNVNRAIDLTLLRKSRSFLRHTLVPLSAAAALVIAALALFFTEAQNPTSIPDSDQKITVVSINDTHSADTNQSNSIRANVELVQMTQTFDSNIVRNVSISLMPDSALAMAEQGISQQDGPGEVIAFTGAPALKPKPTESQKTTNMFGFLFNGST
ncbi:MAG: hypothetical protein JXD22_07890 [Sedimentisphaerales bacterium]|nr:hypothetical protein [Sedimentisphaerales bacterium]